MYQVVASHQRRRGHMVSLWLSPCNHVGQTMSIRTSTCVIEVDLKLVSLFKYMQLTTTHASCLVKSYCYTL